ncbi:hypothetical protein GN958_ATG22761 [Phytophthora infestans]|uniref:Uncharacterized protein n=1 Tax=Phytophthora infestans TaxID=4787 RepID=A0A8S9TJ50_PHYIN|nr:hypothetical protein GN958_ATG22761 [Phytophthora infestans]
MRARRFVRVNHVYEEAKDSSASEGDPSEHDFVYTCAEHVRNAEKPTQQDEGCEETLLLFLPMAQLNLPATSTDTIILEDAEEVKGDRQREVPVTIKSDSSQEILPGIGENEGGDPGTSKPSAF